MKKKGTWRRGWFRVSIREFNAWNSLQNMPFYSHFLLLLLPLLYPFLQLSSISLFLLNFQCCLSGFTNHFCLFLPKLHKLPSNFYLFVLLNHFLQTTYPKFSLYFKTSPHLIYFFLFKNTILSLNFSLFSIRSKTLPFYFLNFLPWDLNILNILN